MEQKLTGLYKVMLRNKAFTPTYVKAGDIIEALNKAIEILKVPVGDITLINEEGINVEDIIG